MALLALVGQTALFAAPQPKKSSVPLPDLTVLEDHLSKQWVVREENLNRDWCSVKESGNDDITPGWHKILRFTVTTPNIGSAPLEVGSPVNNDLFVFDGCHGHYHFKDYALYELVDADNKSVKAVKRGFCMIDLLPYTKEGGASGSPTYTSCRYQGISSGWADTYRFFLGGQYFVVDDVKPGEYIIRITVNPPRKDGSRAFVESDYTNNEVEARIIIPDRPGTDGVGPLRGTGHPSSEPAEH